MRGTSLNALLQECDEIPLSLRREEVMLKYLVKIKNMKEYSTIINILEDQAYPQLGYKCKSFYMDKLEEFTSKNNVIMNTPINQLERMNVLNVDENLFELVNLSLIVEIKENPKLEANVIVAQSIQKHSENSISLFTDGSVNLNHRVGSAFCIPALSISKKLDCLITAQFIVQKLMLSSKLFYLSTI